MKTRVQEVMALAEAKEQEKQKAAEENRRKKLERRKKIADGLEHFLQTVVKPELDDCKKLIIANGYDAKIKEVRKEDGVTKDGNQRLVAVQFQISTHKKPHSILSHCIEYRGTFKRELIICSTTDGQSRPVKTRPFHFNQINNELLVSQVESFLEQAYKVKL